MIKGGYILQPRAIDESEASKYPPHVREIWLYLLRKANHADARISGKAIHRGQLLTSYSDILEDLSWTVGYRKMSYKKHHCETAMKLLTKERMIATAKTTRGMFITICNYDYYQNPENYETDNVSDNETTGKPQESHTINKKKKNVKNVKKGDTGKNPVEKDIYSLVLESFNRLCPSFSKVNIMTDDRRAKIRTRIEEMKSLETAESVFTKMEGSNFLKGDNERKWKATFDWIMENGKNWVKVFEGNYDNKSGNDSKGINDLWNQER